MVAAVAQSNGGKEYSAYRGTDGLPLERVQERTNRCRLARVKVWLSGGGLLYKRLGVLGRPLIDNGCSSSPEMRLEGISVKECNFERSRMGEGDEGEVGKVYGRNDRQGGAVDLGQRPCEFSSNEANGTCCRSPLYHHCKG